MMVNLVYRDCPNRGEFMAKGEFWGRGGGGYWKKGYSVKRIMGRQTCLARNQNRRSRRGKRGSDNKRKRRKRNRVCGFPFSLRTRQGLIVEGWR